MKATRGFTLVELLIVISIIAVLSVVGITVFGGIQKNARDSRRKADIDAISKAYEVRYTAQGNYGDTMIEDTAFISGKLPTPPEGGNYTIIQDNTSKGIKVCAALESNPQRYCTDTAADCICTTTIQETPPQGTSNITYLAGGPGGTGGGGTGGGGTGGGGTGGGGTGGAICPSENLIGSWDLNQKSFNGNTDSETPDIAGNPKLTQFSLAGKVKNANFGTIFAVRTNDGINPPKPGSGIGVGLSGTNAGKVTGNIIDYSFSRIDLGGSTPFPNDGEWHLITLTLNGSQAKLYLDTNEIDSKTSIPAIQGFTDKVSIGVGTGNHWGFYAGLIDKIRLYSKALSPSEIQQLHTCL